MSGHERPEPSPDPEPGEGAPEADAPDVVDAPAPAEDSSLPADPELDAEGRPREP